LPNLKHLILSRLDLPSIESRLTKASNKRIKQLGIDTDRAIEPLTEKNYVYFLNV
jgi:hypothetical protein